MNNINVMGVWLALDVVKATAIESKFIDLAPLALNGFFGAQIAMTDADDSSLIDIEWGVSNDNVTYNYTLDNGDDIVTQFGADQGPLTDGTTFVTFDPMTARFIKFRVTETANSVNAVLTMTVAMH